MPLEQHPVPQEISSYEFRLVGDMTLKQFLQLAGGVGIAFLIFVTPLPGFIKWPFVAIAALAGAALAFLPIEERPLSFWIFSFIKAIYSPTMYSYQPGAAEDVFAKDGVTVVNPQTEEYLNSLPQNAEVSPLEANEKGFFQKVLNMFGHQIQPGQPKPPEEHSLKENADRPQDTRPIEGLVSTYKTESVVQNTPQAPRAFTEAAVPFVPQSTAVKVDHQHLVQTAQQPVKPTYTTTSVSPVFSQGSQATAGQAAVFSLEAAPPQPPQQANTVVGQVVTSQGKIVEGAILEIKEVGGNPVRAIRTNKVGHFLTVTPLKDSEYEVITEKEGYNFDPVRVYAKGQIIPPILIKAKP